MTYDGVATMGGVYASAGTYKRWVRLSEGDNGISIGVADTPELTTLEARRLAKELYRLARRWDRGHAE